MAGSESGHLGKRKASTDHSGGGPSTWRGETTGEDPLMVLGSEIITMILGKLDMRSVAVARLVSRGWQAIASSDRIWAPKDKKASCRSTGEMEACYGLASDMKRSLKNPCRPTCQELWLGKAHIPRAAMVQGLPKIVASLLSIRDGKRSAPEYWRDLDPYWRGAGTPMRRYFHPDGSITAETDDKVWGGHESSYTIVTGLLSDGKVREHYVRINRWPKMTVQRNPDWSWVLRNHLYCYTSIPDAEREGGTGPMNP